ncbi:helix-turn-helix domain-containing protein [Paraburkholderia sp. JPY432]|uniref:helix-turn-helix domain-containing protein n=1 Tax=Paraburkholderia youngii TaxID=2782701 RepID=UPI00159571DD|nr:helix-turn-helix domain-containing protein [Paraburkholderia youngii]
MAQQTHTGCLQAIDLRIDKISMKSQSLERGLDVMELLNASQEPLGPREISRQLGLRGVNKMSPSAFANR